jgi:hypothetical protein
MLCGEFSVGQLSSKKAPRRCENTATSGQPTPLRNAGKFLPRLLRLFNPISHGKDNWWHGVTRQLQPSLLAASSVPISSRGSFKFADAYSYFKHRHQAYVMSTKPTAHVDAKGWPLFDQYRTARRPVDRSANGEGNLD